MRRFMLVVMALCAAGAMAAQAGAKVLRVGTYKGSRGQYKTIQAAVNAAKPGDWILIAPGDYKTKSIHTPKGAPNFPAAVLITTKNLHIRGMDRGKVIVDGTKKGAACNSKAADQNYGLHGSAAATGGYGSASAAASGVNGLMVWKASNVSIENLTACNFLGGSRDAGNEIWWNGGADSGKVGGHHFYGGYLTTTSTFLANQTAAGEAKAAEYGVFSSNWNGGTWNYIYGSNMNDSAFYIGACRQQCNQTVNHAWGEYSALGYSGSNSGGRLLIENSQFDNNEDGFDTNSQNGDNPPPQNGACPHGVKPPVKGAPSCWVFYKNNVHDNNNPNVPAAGSAAAGPVGTGMSVSGGRYDTIMDNTFANNNAWGIILVPYLDSGAPCTGGSLTVIPGSCLFDEWGDAILNNKFKHNGSYGHPSNGDFAQDNFISNEATDCYSGNTEIGGGSISPDDVTLQQNFPDCTGANVSAGSSNANFLGEVLCDSQVELSPGTPATCPSGPYPRVSKIVMHPLPKHGLKSMPNPCAGVPSNPWCTRRKG
jgi:hypothetical protein